MTSPADPTSYLALGDSYTIGESVDESLRWPVQLAARLRARGVELAPPRIVARTGWTTDELSDAIDAAALEPCYGLVSLLIGVNNQYRGRSVADYRDEFARLLERAIAFAGGDAKRVFVLSIPDWGVTPFARNGGRDAAVIARELDAYNEAAREIAAARGVAFVDITGISREPGSGAAMLAGDGLHPSGVQYALWAEAAEPVVARMLGR
ncbi:MAG TPA: SGNH/GDSL hydrolase family protein [Candidatus Saccharimonadia bacterium]|nr:SGNH/GDSL hydrolase family protein [Candidatus Saccharimonadia bacterium]